MRSTRTWMLASDIHQPPPVKDRERPDRALSFTGRYRSQEAAERAGERLFGASGAEYRVVVDLMRKKRDKESRDSEPRD